MLKIISVAFIISVMSLLPQISKAELYLHNDWVKDNTFTQGIEGPAVAKDGHLYVVNYLREGTIAQITGKNQVAVYATLPNDSVGNGIRFDDKGNMYIADYVNHNIWIINKRENDAKPIAKIYAHSSLMNQPNDIAIMNNGILFASDPNWAEGSGQLWRIGRNGQVNLLESEMGTTNGIEVSPDNQTLYVNESVQRKVWQYQLAKDGSISNKKLLVSFDDHGLDGMRCDIKGNLYIARYGKGVIAVISPEGKLLREIILKGKYPTNVAFGGADGKTVFVTMQKRGAIEAFSSEYAGRSYSPINLMINKNEE
jgi:sugar lactone lactonase YvrE